MSTVRRLAPFVAFVVMSLVSWGSLAVVLDHEQLALWTILVSALGILAVHFAGREEAEMPIVIRSTHDIYEVVEHFVPGATTWTHSYRGLVTVEVGGVFLAVIPWYRRRLERRITDALRARGTVGTEWKVVCR